MKSNLTILIVLLMGFCAPGPASAQDEAPPPFEERAEGDARVVDPFDPDALDSHAPKMIRVQFELIEVSLTTLSKLLYLRDPKGDATGMREEVQALIEKGEAKNFETMVLVSRPGQKSTSESIREVIYPTEYEPGEIPEEVKVEKGSSPRVLTLPPTPTAFDMEPTGSVFELEASLGSDDRIVEIRLAPQVVEYAGTTQWTTFKDELGNVNHVQMPDFFTLRITTGVTTRDGDYCFLGVLTPRGEDKNPDYSRKLIAFLKADVTQVGK